MIRLRTSAGFVAAMLLAAGSHGAQPEFLGLGDLPGGKTMSLAAGVSADGRVVCGVSSSAASGTAHEAFRWTAEQGIIALGDLPGGIFDSRGTAISDDGSIIVGASSSANAAWPNTEGFRWDSVHGMRGIGVVSGPVGGQSPVVAVSGDGQVLVGRAAPPGGPTQAFIWTERDGFTMLGVLPGETLAHPGDATFHGDLVVGSASTIYGQSGRRWTRQDGWEVLFPEAGAALSITPDGSIATGRYGAGVTREPLRWTPADGARGLGNPAGTDTGVGNDLSDDGGVVVGFGEDAITGETVAIAWFEQVGTLRLQPWIESNFGLDLTGWTLEAVTGVSADGLVMVGYGLNPQTEREAWRLSLPWIACPADWNHDGQLEPDDLAAFEASWRAGQGDFDEDGVHDTRDWFAYLRVFAAGC